MSVNRSTMLPLKFCGRVMRTVAWSSGTAQGEPMKSLIESATRREVVKSGFLRAEREADLALDEATRRDAAGGGDPGDDSRSVAGGVEAVDGHAALRDGVDLAVCAEQRGHEQG